MIVLLSTVLRVAIPILGILYISDIVVDWFGLLLWQEQVALAVVGLAASDILLTTTARGRSRRIAGTRIPRVDFALAAATLGLCAYIVVRYESIVGTGYLGDPLNLAMAAALICLVGEATRRNAGWPMIILLAGFVTYGLTASHFGGFLQSRSIAPEELIPYLMFDPNAMLGSSLAVVVTTVLAFVLFGSAIFKLGGGDLFIGLALSVMGRFRGGAAKTAVLGSSLFGSISGSAVANVVTTGIITIPLMKKSGYRPEEAGAIEATASTGGQILPPVMGAAAFLVANNLAVSYSEVAKAALVPALLFYLCVFLQCHFRACRRDARALTAAERPKAVPTLVAGWPFVIPLVVLIVLLFASTMSALKAALLSTLITVAAAFVKRETRPDLRRLIGILEDAGQGMLSIVPVVALANMFIGVLSVTGLGFTLSLGIVDTAGGSQPLLLLLVAGVAIVLGMGMPTTAVYLVLAALAAPALIKAGVVPMAAHLYVFYYGVLSMITPPVCLAAFAGAAIAGAGYMRTGWEAVRIGFVAFVLPVLFVYAPELLLLSESATAIAFALVLTAVACVLVSAAIEGFLFSRLGIGERVAMWVVASLLGFALIGSTASISYIQIVAIIGAVLIVLWSLRRRREFRANKLQAPLDVATAHDTSRTST